MQRAVALALVDAHCAHRDHRPRVDEGGWSSADVRSELGLAPQSGSSSRWSVIVEIQLPSAEFVDGFEMGFRRKAGLPCVMTLTKTGYFEVIFQSYADLRPDALDEAAILGEHSRSVLGLADDHELPIAVSIEPSSRAFIPRSMPEAPAWSRHLRPVPDHRQ